MKIENLLIDNFRGISKVEASGLGNTIIVAGQNGSGKSCLFDAIRLLKSTYGGYHQNEWQNFFGEFAIQLHGGSKYLKGLFNDPERPLVIEAKFQLRDAEKAYITANAAELLEEAIWQTLLPEAFQFGGYRRALFANQFRERQPEVDKKVQDTLPQLQSQLSQSLIDANIEVNANGQVKILESPLLFAAFTNYRPREIGVFDFHGAQRHYGRENVQGINLSLDQANQVQSQSTLYNYNNKYNNVKSEMAADFIKELLAEKASPAGSREVPTLIDTLKELFEAFFPDKRFLGPRANRDGSLSFPVVTANGREHDLDELSSGEKEILYGYLRIRSSAPRNSIIMLDEPELHLNPRLIRGLPEFYRKHLGEALQNQLWLVTHSDALIREAVGKPGFNVFHMLPCTTEGAATSQMRPLTFTRDLDTVLADLVGDLAAYRPGGKGVIFEGGGDSDFDKTLTGMLFVEELRGVNLISGTNKIRVRLLHEVLNRAYQNGDLPTKFYAVVDGDTESVVESGQAINRFVWDVYHIENYLINVSFIRETIASLKMGPAPSVEAIDDALARSARTVVPNVLISMMRSYVNSKLVRTIDLGFPPDTLTIGRELHSAAARSLNRMTSVISSDLSEAALVAQETLYRNEIESSFADGTWRSKLPGREILRNFVTAEGVGVSYEIFRNLIADKMASASYKPEGMTSIIAQICAD